jgi:hypothetical protein
MSPAANQSYPLQKGFNTIQFLAWAAALLMVVLSLLGLIFPDQIYSDPTTADEFMTNDLVNLVIGLPLFLISLYYFRREELMGLLLLPGALIYTIYNYFAYLLGKPFNWIGGLTLVLVLLCGYILFLLLSSLDHQVIRARLAGKTSEKLTGWILVFFGLAFIALALSEIIPGILDGSIPPLGEKAVSVADILVSIGWVYGGVILLQRRALGYSLSLGLLLAASSLFIGLILYFFFAPLLTGRALDWVEVLTVFVMGLICFGPTFLFLRGVVRGQKKEMIEP